MLRKLGPGQSEVAEDLCQRLQQKERMLQDLLSDRNKQTVEHEMEIQGLLQSMGTREQERQVSLSAEPDEGPVMHSWPADRKGCLWPADRKGCSWPADRKCPRLGLAHLTVNSVSFLQFMKERMK